MRTYATGELSSCHLRQSLQCAAGPRPSNQLKDIIPTVIHSPTLLYDHFPRSFLLVYKNVICSILLNLPLNPHLHSSVCPISLLPFIKKSKQTKPLKRHVYLCCLCFLSPILSTHSNQTFSPMVLLNPPLLPYLCSPPCHIQRSFLSLIFPLATLGIVNLSSFLKQSPLSPGFLPTILFSLAEFSSDFLLLNDRMLYHI